MCCCCCLLVRGPHWNGSKKRSEICFSFPFSFFPFQQLGQGRKLVGCRRWLCFACYIRRRGAGWKCWPTTTTNRESVHATTRHNKVKKVRWEREAKRKKLLTCVCVLHRVQSRPIVTDPRPPWLRQQPMLHYMLHVIFSRLRWLTAAHPWEKQEFFFVLLKWIRKTLGNSRPPTFHAANNIYPRCNKNTETAREKE